MKNYKCKKLTELQCLYNRPLWKHIMAFPSDFINPFMMLKLVASSFGKRVANFSEQRSRHVLSVISAYWNPCIYYSYPWDYAPVSMASNFFEWCNTAEIIVWLYHTHNTGHKGCRPIAQAYMEWPFKLACFNYKLLIGQHHLLDKNKC